MKVTCNECNTTKTINDEKLISFSGKIISTKCANRQCSYRIKFKVPVFSKDKNEKTKQSTKTKEKIIHQNIKDKSTHNLIVDTPKKKSSKSKNETLHDDLSIAVKPKSGVFLLIVMILSATIGIIALTAGLEGGREMLPMFIFFVCCPVLLIIGYIILLSEVKQNEIKISKYSKVSRIIVTLILTAPIIAITFSVLYDYLNYYLE